VFKVTVPELWLKVPPLKTLKPPLTVKRSPPPLGAVSVPYTLRLFLTKILLPEPLAVIVAFVPIIKSRLVRNNELAGTRTVEVP